jgi:hypothetical protein
MLSDGSVARLRRFGASGRSGAARMTPPAIPDRGVLEEEHIRILAHAVGDQLPYELALRAQAVAEQLQRCA